MTPVDLDLYRQLTKAARELLDLDADNCSVWTHRYARDVPALLAELKRLQQENDRLHRKLSHWSLILFAGVLCALLLIAALALGTTRS